MSSEPRRLKEILDRGRICGDDRIQPPQGYEYHAYRGKRQESARARHGINVTDNTAAIVRAGSLPVSRILYEIGHDPVMQMTCRDRNRIAMQSDLMGAHILGIRNILCLTGDYPTVGDHKDAKPVYDLDSVQVMQLVKGLNNGRD